MDKRRQELEELRDDIHLTLLMDEYAESTGAEIRAVTERAFENNEITIPSELDAACASILAQTEKAEHSTKSAKAVFRYLLVSAAAIVVFLGALIAVQAAGINVFGKTAFWTDSVFRYKAQEKPMQVDNDAYPEITAALEELGIPGEFSPCQLPEGYTVSNIEKSVAEQSNAVGVTLKKEDRESYIFFAKYTVTDLIENAVWEKNDQPVTVYSSNGRDFYVFKNQQGWKGAWSDGKYVITLLCFASEEDVLETIQAIGVKKQ